MYGAFITELEGRMCAILEKWEKVKDMQMGTWSYQHTRHNTEQTGTHRDVYTLYLRNSTGKLTSRTLIALHMKSDAQGA